LITLQNFEKVRQKFQKNTKNQQKECNMMVFPPFSQPLNLASYNYRKIQRRLYPTMFSLNLASGI